LSSRIQREYCIQIIEFREEYFIFVKRIITEDEQEERNGGFGKEQW
jgi:hypothetical protein